MAQEQLPELRTRAEVQAYLCGVAAERGVPLEHCSVAGELDRRDQLASFRGKFNVPTIGQLLEEKKICSGTLIMPFKHACRHYIFSLIWG